MRFYVIINQTIVFNFFISFLTIFSGCSNFYYESNLNGQKENIIHPSIGWNRIFNAAEAHQQHCISKSVLEDDSATNHSVPLFMFALNLSLGTGDEDRVYVLRTDVEDCWRKVLFSPCDLSPTWPVLGCEIRQANSGNAKFPHYF